METYLSSIASSIAAHVIRRHLAAGGTIDVPSLGITIGGTMTNDYADELMDAIYAFIPDFEGQASADPQIKACVARAPGKEG